MTNNKTVIAPPRSEPQAPKVSLGEVVAVEILQDNFASDAAREEFSQAIKLHGITFLYLSNSQLPNPSARDLSVMGRFARLLANIWPQALVVGGCHD